MTKKTINQLTDIGNTQESTAVVAIEQNGSTFKAPVRPNPPRQINVTSQAQLEAELGVNIEIPDGEKITIVVDESFTLTKPFKIGDGSVLELYASVIEGEITYTGTETMFQQNTANPIRALLLHDMFIQNGGTQILCDLIGTSRIFIEQIRIEGFKGAVMEFPFVKFDNLAAVNWREGLIVRNPVSLQSSITNVRQSLSIGIIFLSIITNIVSAITISKNPQSILASIDSLLFFDSSAPVGSSFIVDGTTISAGDFFQSGTTFAITNVVSGILSKARFQVGAPHNLTVGQRVALSGFSESTYNQTVVVRTIPTASEFETDIDFVAADTGTANSASLDQTDVGVFAQDNPMQPDSMFTGDAGLEVFGTPIISSSLAQDAFEVITSASWAYNNLERFSIGVNNEGQLVTDEPSTRRYKVDYFATLEKSGGGALDIGIVILKNGAIISFNAPHTTNSGLVQISGSDIVELASADTIQIAVINYNASAAVINTSQVNMVINRA